MLLTISNLFSPFIPAAEYPLKYELESEQYSYTEKTPFACGLRLYHPFRVIERVSGAYESYIIVEFLVGAGFFCLPVEMKAARIYGGISCAMLLIRVMDYVLKKCSIDSKLHFYFSLSGDSEAQLFFGKRNDPIAVRN